MNYRELGRTGMKVSEVGFGTWGIGNTSWIGADKRASVQALIAAYDAGINFFDTAWVYGRGESERLLARVFGRSANVFIASKVPPRNWAWPAVPGIPLREVFPPAHVLGYLRKTLANLRRDIIDLYQFHVWNDEWIQDPDWLELIDRLRRTGRARAIGISINDHQPRNALAALATGRIDTVQVIYNIFDQSPEDHLFPYCIDRGIGVIARVPFDEGGLTGCIRPDTTFPERDFRNRYFEGERKREVWERVQSIAADAGIPIEHMPNLALRFCLSQPAVSTVIAGMRKANHVRMNAAASGQGPIPRELLNRLRSHRWVRNFYPSPTMVPASTDPRDLVDNKGNRSNAMSSNQSTTARR
jgi:aryl-alcohol dehydrogenase-like predicted oxidoreductase